MPTTDLTQLPLTTLDLVYAISQQQLNGTVAAALVEQTPPPVIQFAYALNGGDWIPASDPSTATLTFSGTWAPAMDSSGTLRVPIIDMSQSPSLAAGQVILNLTFAVGATLTDVLLNKTYVQQDPTLASTPADIWTVPMVVNLSLAALTNLPAQVKSQLDVLNGQYGDIFSAQQIIADLGSLVPLAKLNPQTPTDVDQVTWQFFQTCLGDWFKSSEAAGQLPLAYLLQQTGTTPVQTPPAFAPTAADFVVIPNGSLSALVFAMMSQGRALPSGLADIFDGYGFTDPNATGTVLIRSALVNDVLCTAVADSQIPAELSFYLAVGPPAPDWPTFTKTSDPQVPSVQSVVPTSANNQQIASFNYTNTQANSNPKPSFSYWSGFSTVNNSMSVNLQPSDTEETPSQINVSGSVVVQCNAEFGSGQHSHDAELNPTTFAWYADFRLQADLTTHGQIDLALTDSNFNEPPVTAGDDGWDQFLAELTGTSLKQDFNGIMETLSSYVSGSVQTTFTNSFANIQSFVLPGNNVFTFSGVFISSTTGNLVSNLQYTDPD